MPRLIVAGEPGEAYENDTGKVVFQLIVNWHNSCGLCCQFDHQVGDFWPIPFHRNCNCKNVPILPGMTARPFVDYRAKILTVDRSQQAAIMGRANLEMVESGLVEWSDVVTPSRVRSLREVVSRKKLTVDQMVGAGVGRSHAEEAFRAVHTATHTASESRRRAQVDALLRKGYTRQQVIDAAGRAIGSRVGIVEGPSGPGMIAYTPKPTPRPVPKKKPERKSAALPPKPATRLAPPNPVAPDEPSHVAEWRKVAREELPRVASRRKAARDELDAAQAEAAAADAAYKRAAAAFADSATLKAADAAREAARGRLRDAARAFDVAESRFERLNSWEKDREKIPNLIPPVGYPRRIELYTEGDRKVESIIGLGDEVRKHFERESAVRQELRAKWEQLDREVRSKESLKFPKKQRAALDELRAERDRLQAELVATRVSIDGVRARVREGMADLLKVDRPADLPVEVREMSPENVARVREAEAFLKGKFAAGDSPTVRIKGREIPDSEKQRDYCSGDTIHLSAHTKADVVVHEIGHSLDAQATLGGRQAGRSTVEFLSYRVGDEVPRPMQEFSQAFDRDEMGRKDKFDEVFDESGAYYTGKIYPGQTGSEVLSMGLQQLYNDPVHFAKKDPEFLKFILGMLDGSLR